MKLAPRMPTLSVLKEPNATLRERAIEVDPKEIGSDRVQQLVDDMTTTMYASNGVGIAAPQVGMKERVIIVETGRDAAKAFINPRIVSTSFRKVDSEEGCLSVPGVYGIVKRHKKVTVEALDRQGKSVKLVADKLLAIIFQHEIDHLDGVLFIDRVERYTSPPRL